MPAGHNPAVRFLPLTLFGFGTVVLLVLQAVLLPDPDLVFTDRERFTSSLEDAGSVVLWWLSIFQMCLLASIEGSGRGVRLLKVALQLAAVGLAVWLTVNLDASLALWLFLLATWVTSALDWRASRRHEDRRPRTVLAPVSGVLHEQNVAFALRRTHEWGGICRPGESMLATAKSLGPLSVGPISFTCCEHHGHRLRHELWWFPATASVQVRVSGFTRADASARARIEGMFEALGSRADLGAEGA